MNNSILIDTNILFYLKDVNSSFHEKSIKFIESYNGTLFTTSKNLSEYLVATTRGDNPFNNPDNAIADINEFSSFFNVLFPNNESLKLLLRLINEHQTKGKKIHDFEIAAIALVNHVNHILTKNEEDFYLINDLEIISI